MRLRQYILLVTLTLLVILIALRQHARDLGEVLQTYGSFYGILRQHSDLLYRYAPKKWHHEASSTAGKTIPKTIHQIFLSQQHTNSSMDRYTPAMQSCKALHPGWTFQLWTNTNATDFMEEYYPDIFPHYSKYAQTIQQANVLRYALLHHYGGVYLDLDVTCLVPLDALLESDPAPAFLTPGAYPAGVNNAFILSRPNHPFLGELLSRVPSRKLFWGMPYVENMLSTGCMFFSNAWTAYVLENARNWKDDGINQQDRVYVLADEEGNLDGHMLRGKTITPLFEHGGASSWHGWDANIIVFVGRHYGIVSFLFLFGLLAGIAVVWRLAGRYESLPTRKWYGSGVMNRRSSLDEEKALLKLV